MITAKEAIERAVNLTNDAIAEWIDGARISRENHDQTSADKCEDRATTIATLRSAIEAIDLERKPRSDRKQERDAAIIADSATMTPAELAARHGVSKQRISVILKATRDKA